MAKDPAFLFYPNDWLGGTLGMSFEEKGAFMELLMMQFNRGHMTSHMIGQVVGQTWDNIKHKFIEDESGLWYNKRLDEEIYKRKNFTKSRRNNMVGTNQHTKNKDNVPAHMNGHMTSHMEDENENENESINTIKIGKENKFDFNDITLLPENYILSIQEQMFSLQAQKLEPKKILDLWEAFRLEKITGDKTYRSKKDVYLHFVNWIKKQKFTTTTSTKNELRDLQRQEYANRHA